MPRLGLGSIDLSATTGGGNSVTGIDDFFFESFTAGQMHPIRTASRTNLILQSQTIRTSPWSLENFGTDTDLYLAPNSTTTAQSISLETANDQVYAQQVVSIVAGKTYTFSAHLKKGALDFSSLLVYDSVSTISHLSYFNIATGTAQGSGSNIIRSAVDAMDNGWYRCSITFQALNSVSGIFRVYVSEASGSPATGSGTQANIPVAYLWGTQIEEDGFPSAYIPTVGSTVTVSTTLNDTSEVWDFDGTDIMIAEDPEDEGFWEESYPDGATLPELVLNGDYEELGSELVTNGDFPTGTTAWTVGSGWNIANGIATASPAADYLSQASVYDHTTVETYKITYDITVDSGTFQFLILGKTGSGFFGNQTTSGTYTVYFTTTGSSGDGRLFIAHQGGFDGDVNSVSVKQVDPNDRWTLGTNWSIEDGKAVGASTTTNLQQLSILEVGTTYELTFTISDYSSGSVRSNIGGVDGASRSSDGTFTEIIGPATTTHFYFDGVSAFTGKIDNVSIKEYAIQPLDI